MTGATTMPPGVRVVARQDRDMLGEGLMWSAREQALYWTDILGRRLHRLDLTKDAVRSWDMPEMIGWVVERARGGLIAGLHRSIAELDLEPFAIRPIVHPEPHLPDNRRNDAKADRFGRIWAGSMDIGYREGAGSLYRLDPDGGLHVMDTGYAIANGPAFSADGRWLYHTDTGRATVYRFPLDEAGQPGARETFIRFAPDWGYPDGMTVDAEGGLWIAHWGGSRVTRFVDGRPERAIELPTAQITNCTFAGPELDRMFVTSAADGRPDDPLAGCLFEVDPGVVGTAPAMFGG